MGRIITYHPWGLENEPGLVHPEAALAAMVMEKSRPVGTPVVPEPPGDTEGKEELQQRRSSYRDHGGRPDRWKERSP